MRLVGELGGYLNQAVMLAGIVIAVVRWRRHPLTSRIVVISLAMPMLVSLALPLNLPFVQQWLERISGSQRSLLLGLASTLWKTARAVSYVLLLVATLGPRPNGHRGGSRSAEA